jgi:hypothetical protein
MILFPVTLVYRIPNSKKGYFKTFAKIIGIIMSQPYCAPAFVESTKCEVPIAILANNSPGPRFLRSVLYFDIVVVGV